MSEWLKAPPLGPEMEKLEYRFKIARIGLRQLWWMLSRWCLPASEQGKSYGRDNAANWVDSIVLPVLQWPQDAVPVGMYWESGALSVGILLYHPGFPPIKDAGQLPDLVDDNIWAMWMLPLVKQPPVPGFADEALQRAVESFLKTDAACGIDSDELNAVRQVIGLAAVMEGSPVYVPGTPTRVDLP